jgi:two-component system, response regulator
MQLKEVDILFLEDSAEDAELCIRMLRKQNLANHLHRVRDGEEALDFIFGTGLYAGQTPRTGSRSFCSI